MHVDLRARARVPATRDAAFALTLDPVRFPATFRGYGPIPAIHHITLHAAPAVGATRELRNRDGSRPLERITALEPPSRHAYELTGIAAPFSWLVRRGLADWRFAPHEGGTLVDWHYRFELTHPLAWIAAAPLLRAFMRPAMRRCLDAMSQALRDAPPEA
jgi:hypothetical protein